MAVSPRIVSPPVSPAPLRLDFAANPRLYRPIPPPVKAGTAKARPVSRPRDIRTDCSPSLHLELWVDCESGEE